MKKMWSGRFRQPLDPQFEAWQRSLPFDRRLLPEEIAASAAYARALTKAGVLSNDELISILQALEKIEGECAGNPGCFDESDAEDVHHFVEQRLVEAIGDAGYKLHTGRSRNEQIATDLRLYVRGNIDIIQDLLLDLVNALVEQAEKAGDAAMPAYTHLQAAEPVLVAHWLLAYLEMFLRDAARLEDCRTRANVCPLGSGAVAGAPLPLDRVAIARELGFSAPTANSIDATSDRDFAIEFVQSLALMFVHLSRWAEELILFSTPEFGFVRLPESFSTGSSAMPQKKNPDALELMRGKSAQLFGNLTTLLVAVKGLPLAYNKDLQETQRPIFEAADAAINVLRTAAGVMRNLEFDHARMHAAATSGCMNALAGAMYLVKKGVPFRLAHEQVGHAVRLCLERGCELQDLPLGELQTISQHFDEGFFSSLTLEGVLGCHNLAGGTGLAAVHEALSVARWKIAKRKKEQLAHA
jgi:argininosuccinate lyase